ncbi:hypothetical protein UFOVP28_56 [uncultured Caudovirales phage]|uniref:Uncharacterized protein n=1 Tax=uncultured Caudovirales phage TaxID=2100421 RepID=A0A6J5KNQ4_9CAUD|nr:hypothetical protein UFOVP28_56 [uncultured Caudovirales phage]
MYKVSVVFPAQVVDVWEKAEPFLKQVVDITDGRTSMSFLLNRVIKEDCNLWVIYDPDSMDIVGSMITKINEYPHARFLTVEMLAGDDFDEWIDQAHDALILFAKHFLCDGLELIGRRGWVKKLQRLQWKEKFTTCQLIFEGTHGEGWGELDSSVSNGI